MFVALLLHNKFTSLEIRCRSLHIRQLEDIHFLFREPIEIGMQAFMSWKTAQKDVMLDGPNANTNRAYHRFLLALLLISGDVSTNPGPGKHHCCLCSKSVSRNQPAVCCDNCNERIYKLCSGLGDQEYRRIQRTSNSCVWLCQKLLPNFSDSFFEDVSVDSHPNIYDNLASLTMTENTEHGEDEIQGSGADLTANLQKKPKKMDIKILAINCRGLRSKEKQAALLSLVDTHQPEIINATENFLTKDIKSSELSLQNFEVFRSDRTNHEDGVMIAVKDTLLPTELNEPMHDDLESIWCKIEISGFKPLYNGFIYRPPDSRSEPLIGLERSLDKLLTDRNLCHVHLSGDFSLPSIDCDTADNEDKYSVKSTPQYGQMINQHMINMVQSHSLSQKVIEPTGQSNILDIVLTTTPNLITTSVHDGISDHQIVISNLDIKAKIVKKNQEKF